MSASRVSVVVATVHRPDDLATTLEGLLAHTRRPFEIVVVDQSADQASRRACGRLLERPEVHYRRRRPPGLSAALNEGARHAKGPWIAVVGDDCSVGPGWLDGLDQLLQEREPAPSLIFANVLSAEHDPAEGFVPGCRIEEERWIRRPERAHRINGTTACMLFTRELWSLVGGFDESLGLGARFHAGEDLDLALRALLAGRTVGQSPAIEVTHRTAMSWAERAPVVRRNWYGSGAVFGKLARRHPLTAARALLGLGGRWTRGSSGVAVTYGRRPARSTMLRSFVRGFFAGLWAGSARDGHFRRRDSREELEA